MGDGCISSPNFPDNYTDLDDCRIRSYAPDDARINASFEFETEAGYDFLQINGQKFSGRKTPELVNNITGLTGEDLTALDILWEPDFSSTRRGWKLCLEALSTPAPTPPPCFEQDVSYRPYLQTPKLRTAGAVECLARCQDHVDCAHFSFHSIGRCFFAAASAWKRPARHFVTGSATCALPPTAMPTPVPTRPPTHSKCFARDVSFRPFLETPKLMTNNATECLNGCRDNPACKKFSFFSKEGHHYGRCFFAGDSAYMQPARHFVTGLETCTPPA